LPLSFLLTGARQEDYQLHIKQLPTSNYF